MYIHVSKPSVVRSEDAYEINIEAEKRNTKNLHIKSITNYGSFKNTGVGISFVKHCRGNVVKQIEENLMQINGNCRINFILVNKTDTFVFKNYSHNNCAYTFPHLFLIIIFDKR